MHEKYERWGNKLTFQSKWPVYLEEARLVIKEEHNWKYALLFGSKVAQLRVKHGSHADP